MTAYDIFQAIDKVLSYYGAFLDVDVVEKLEDVRHTELMTSVRELLQKGNFNYNPGGVLYWDFYEAGQKLKKVTDKELMS